MKQVCVLFLMSLIFCLSSSKSSAEVIFTDIDDLSLEVGGSIEINMDNNGVAEFTIEDGGFDNIEPAIYFLEGHHLTTVSADEWDVLDDVAEGNMIDASSAWFNYGDAYLDPFWGNTAFPVNSDVFMGAQFKLGTNVHFGWIKVHWDGNGGLIVKSYGYESVPNTGILAGDEGGSTGPVLVQSISVTSVSGLNEITEQGGSLQMIATVLPQNASNTELVWTVENQSGEATISLTGELTAVSDGVVTVKATAIDGSGVFGEINISISNQTVGFTSLSAKSLNIYPNPVSDVLHLEGFEREKVLCRIFTYTGKLVMETSLEVGNQTINTTSFKAGVYLLELIEGNNVYRQQFVKK